MNKQFLFALAALSILGSPAFAQTLVDSCYTASDTDSSEMDQPSPIRVDIYSDNRGYFAELKDTATSKNISTQLPVAMSGARENPSWIFNSLEIASQPNVESLHLEIYRTSLKPRTPTTVNAHLRYWNHGSKRTILIDRLECRKMNL